MKNYDFRITTDTKTITGSCAIGFSPVSGAPYINFQSVTFNEPVEAFMVECNDVKDKIRTFFINKLNEDFDSLTYTRILYIDLRSPLPTPDSTPVEELVEVREEHLTVKFSLLVDGEDK